MYTKLLRACMFHGLSIGLFLLLICITSLAQANDQGDRTITLSGTGITIKKIFNAIRDQTGIMVMYNQGITKINQDEKVTVTFKSTSVNEVLSFLFSSKDLDWTFNENVVVIYRKSPKPDKIAERSNSADTANVLPLLTGKVTDEQGNALPGATVIIKGTSLGTSTDNNGNFSLPNVSSNSIIQISSLGFSSQELKIQGKRILARLNLDINRLDETVVIAYGTTTKRFNTGSVNSVKAEEIARQPVNNPILALQGRVPGLVISQQTGVSGGTVDIQIRGRSSLNSLVRNDPLYIVDGVPYTSTLLRSEAYTIFGGDNRGTSGNPFNFLNPSDIESIEVLKDADATSIYGSRGANGVILITTKKGKPGSAKIDLNVYSGIGKVVRKMDLMNTPQYLQMRREAFANDKITPDVNNAVDLFLWDTTRYTDWQKELIGGTAHFTDAQASVSGGGNNAQYLIGTGYHRESTVFPSDFADQKVSTHFNINGNSNNQKFHFSLSGNYMVDNNNVLQVDMMNYINLAPNAPAPYNPDGSLNWEGSTWSNPMASLNSKFRSRANNLISNATVSYNILDNLELKTSLGYTNMQIHQVAATPLTAYDPALWSFIPRYTSFTDNSIRSWIVEPQINYNIQLGKGKLTALVGTTLQQNNSDGQSIAGSGFTSDLLIYDVKSAPNVRVTYTSQFTYKYNALFGRLNYQLKDRYILNFTARRDGSSRFGPANQFHNFGSAGAAWIFSKENAIAKALPFLSFGKLRGSYGTTGNDQIGDYRFLDLYAATTFPYQDVQGLVINNHFNPNLAWEESRKFEAGLELGFWADRILFTGNYYRNRSSNQLVDYALPGITGFGSILSNQPAVVQNTGIELMLNTTNIRGREITWSTSFNISIPRNKLISYPGFETSTYASSLVIGQPSTIQKVYNFAGVNDSSGLYQFYDAKGAFISAPSGVADRNAIINKAPKFYGGFQNNITYKGFEIDFLFQFVKQDGVVYRTFGMAGFGGTNQPLTALQRWQKPGDNTNIQKFSQDYGDPFTAYFNATESNFMIGDASFIRLKNVSISYNIPAKWKERIHLKSCRIYLQGQNLLTFTGYKGFDPETQSLTYLPPLRVFTAGIQLSL